MPSRCSFGRGLVVDDNSPNTFADWNGTPFTDLQTAQRTALNNGCKYGVYKKVNSAVNFCPDSSDTLGTWTCSYVMNNITYSSGTKNSTILEDLVSRGFLDQEWQFSSSYRVETGQFNHLTAWSTDATQDPAGSPWTVRAVIQTDYELGAEMQFNALECTVDAPGARNTIISMSSIYDIKNWGLVMQGLMYNGADTPAVSNVPDQLAMLLNTMVMISGGNNNLNSAPAADDDQNQGCLSTVAYVPTGMVVVAISVAALLVVLAIAWLCAWLHLSYLKRHAKPRNPGRAGEIELLPQAIEEWALLAARGPQAAEELAVLPAQGPHGAVPRGASLADLRQYLVGFLPGLNVIGVYRRETIQPPVPR